MKIFISFLVTILIWIGFYYLEIYAFNWNYATKSIFVQTMFCWFYLSNSIILVPVGEQVSIVFWLTQKIWFSLGSGVYSFPLFTFWGQIFKSKKEKKEKGNKIKINSSKPIYLADITFLQGLAKEFLIPFILRKNFKTTIFALILSIIIGYSSVNMKEMIPKISSFNFFRTLENTPSLSKEDSYEIMPNPDPLFSLDHGVNYYGNNLDYMSLDPGNPNFDIKWNSVLKKYDDYTLAVKVNRSTDYVYESGYFMSPKTSENFFPKVYVDGYKGNQDYFEKFFYVHINRLIIPRDELILNKDMGLREYVNFIKTDKRINMYCYRDIVIVLRKEFQDKLTWYLIDAGWGNDKKFMIFHGSSQVVLNE